MADKEKTAAELEREKIGVTTSKETEQETETETEQETETETETEEETTTETEKEAVEETEKEIEKSEKTEEDLEKEKKEAKTQAEKDRIQKRIDREISKRKAAEAERDALKKQLEANPDKKLTEEEVERRSEERANIKAAERQFVNDCNKLAADALKFDKNFDEKIEIMKEEIGGIPSQMIGILSDIDNGGEVLSYLVNNLEEMEDISVLSTAKMALAITKISNKLETDKKPKPKPISKVPNPVTPIKGNQKSNLTLTGKESMEEYVKIRNEQIEARRKAKLAGMRP